MEVNSKEKKKALLIITGGRAIPNVLSLLWLQPQLVRVILSKQGWDKYKPAFTDIANSIPGCKLEYITDIDAYNINAGMQACRDACTLYPDDEWDWTFEITSSPKVTGIAAYEVAKEKHIPCWHIDTQREQHISLIQHVEVDLERFFDLTLDDYMTTQHRTWEIPNKIYREQVKQWTHVARELVLSPTASELLSLFYEKKKEYKKNGGNGDPVHQEFELPHHLIAHPALPMLETEKLITVKKQPNREILWSFTSGDAAKFIGTGDWLEFYVWNEAINAGLVDEEHCQWGCSVYEGSLEKEFDLALIYKAQLIVAECKAESNPFQAKKQHLHKLAAKANVLGGSYVGKLFITNQPATGGSIKSFLEQAEQYKIVVVTAEQLPEIACILEKEAKNPKYGRV